MGARGISLRRMLPAIDFHDEPPLDAAEIHDMRTDGPLSLELKAAEPAVAQLSPHGAFRVRHALAERPSVAADTTHWRSLAMVAPSPNPLPQAGEGYFGTASFASRSSSILVREAA